jgi:sugar phosphate isomerase/epimerase
MIPTISQICSLQSPFEKDIEDYAAAQCTSIELWLGKLEAWLESNSREEFKRLVKTHNVTTPVASFQGGILASQGEKRKEAWELLDRRLELLHELGVQTLVVACDVMPPISNDDVERVQVSLKQAAMAASKHQVRLAVEFQSKAAFGNNLQTAAALIEEANAEAKHEGGRGHEHGPLGICLDVFHFHNGPSKLADLALLSKENLFHVQLSDVADVPREFATDTQRIMPGEGDAPTAAILSRLRQIGYEDCISIETMNPQIWQVPALQFGEVAMTSLQQLLAQQEKMNG